MFKSIGVSIYIIVAWYAISICTADAEERELRKKRIIDRDDKRISPSTIPHAILLMKDVLINADYWDNEPKIFSAEYAFDGILGIPPPLTADAVKEAGGAFEVVECSNGLKKTFTRAPQLPLLVATFGHPSKFGDGLPVVFSWPVLPSSVQATDFIVTLNTGQTVIPDAISIYPNSDYNERNTVVLVSPDLGNRLRPDEEGAEYPVEIRIAKDDTPLMLVGPKGQVSGVGLTYDTRYHPYVNGPQLIIAKLSVFKNKGDDGPGSYGINKNSGKSIYRRNVEYRLRILTNWGISPDGLLFIRPDQYEDYFYIQVELQNGDVLNLTTANYVYLLDGHELEILGLAELGTKSRKYDDCYVDDRDNQIDIILKGDEEAMRLIKKVVLPSNGKYKAVYNPGGPGPNPEKGVRYTAPSTKSVADVIMAIDDPMVVNYQGKGLRNKILSTNRRERKRAEREIMSRHHISSHVHN